MKGASISGVIAVLIGLYLLAVVANGKAEQFVTVLGQDLTKPAGRLFPVAFVYWLVAFLVLFALASRPATAVIGKPLFGVALVALTLNLTGTGFLANIGSYFTNPSSR